MHIPRCYSASFPANWCPPCRTGGRLQSARVFLPVCVCVWCVYSLTTTMWARSVGPQYSWWCWVSMLRSQHWCWYKTSLWLCQRRATQISRNISTLHHFGFGSAAASPHWKHIVAAHHVFLINCCLFGRLGRIHAKLQQRWVSPLTCLLRLRAGWCCSCRRGARATAVIGQQMAGRTHACGALIYLQPATDVGRALDVWLFN